MTWRDMTGRVGANNPIRIDLYQVARPPDLIALKLQQIRLKEYWS